MKRYLDLLHKALAGRNFMLLNAISIAGTVVGMGLAYLFQPIATRFLSPSDYGILAVMVAIWSTLTIPLGALTSTLAREMSARESDGATVNFLLRKYVQKFGIYSSVVSVLAALAAFFFGQPLLSLLFLGLPAAVLLAICSAWLQARERILELTIVQNGQNLLRVLALLLFLFLGWGLFGATLALPAYALAMLVLLLVWLMPQTRAQKHVDIHLRYVFGMLVLLQLAQIVLLYEDLFAVQYFLGAVQTGVYNVAEITAKILFLLAGAIGLVLYPKIAKLTKEALASEGLRLLLIGMSLLVPVFIGFQLVAQPFMAFFYPGPVYAASVGPFRILSIAMLLAGWAQLMTFFILARHGEKPTLLVYGFVLALNAFVQWWVVPLWGLVGAAWGASASLLLLDILLAVLLWRELRKSR